MDVFSSTLSHASFDPELTTSSFVKSLQLLATLSSYVNESWPENSPVKDGDHFDFIIVGGGTAGAALAHRLTEERDWRVLLVEAGGDPPLLTVIPGIWPLLTHGPEDWDYVSEEDGRASQELNGGRTTHTSGKVLGGCSTIGHLLCQRGSSFDYDAWAEAGHAGWGWDSVLKYFKKSENMLDKDILNGPTAKYHCDRGPFRIKPQTVNKVFKEKNHRMLKLYEEIGMRNTLRDPLIPIPDGNSEVYLSITDEANRRASTAEEYLLRCKNRNNLYLQKRALATKLIIKDNRAIGVKVKTKFGMINVFADLEVIVSAGVFNSPKLLMLSGIGPREDLERLNIPVIQDLPVGRNFQDQVFAPIVISGESNLVSTLDSVLSITELGSFPGPAVTGTFSSSSGTLDMQHISLTFGTLSPLLFYLLLINFNFNLEVSKSFLLTDAEKEKLVVFVALVKPKSRGRVTLNSADPCDPPKIFNNYLAEDDDTDRLVEAVNKILNLKDTSYIKSAGGKFIRPPLKNCDHLPYESNEYWSCYVKNLASTLYHATSSCSMGAVVDERLRVKGVKNLRVIDSSVMPMLPGAGTLLPTLMVAEKGADLIKEDHGKNEGRTFPCS